MKLLSVVVPCFNEQEAIPYFYEAITKTADEFRSTWPEIEFEFLFIDDGSKDGTLKEILALRDKDSRVRFVSFSRNFGKEAGLYAGLEHSHGDYVVTMDVDLQDPPALLPQMFRAVYEEGFDSAATRRVDRKGEPPIRSFFARCFYKIINKMSNAEIVDGAHALRRGFGFAAQLRIADEGVVVGDDVDHAGDRLHRIGADVAAMFKNFFSELFFCHHSLLYFYYFWIF